LECVVKKGKGNQHAKFSPVAVCAMSYEPKIHFNDSVLSQLSQKQKQAFVDVCPKKVFSCQKQLEATNP
jgi:DNA-directed RNA polymerase II subunit RPB3